MKNRNLKLAYNAPVILTYVILCFIATLIDSCTKANFTATYLATNHSSFLNPLTYIRLFTHVIGHYGFEHFFNNAIWLLLLGPILEDKYGSVTMLRFILLTAFVSGICLNFTHTNTAGASGVVFAFIILSSFTSFKNGEIPLTSILTIIYYLGKEVQTGISVNDNVSQLGHIVGGIVGAFSGYILNKKKS